MISALGLWNKVLCLYNEKQNHKFIPKLLSDQQHSPYNILRCSLTSQLYSIISIPSILHLANTLTVSQITILSHSPFTLYPQTMEPHPPIFLVRIPMKSLMRFRCVCKNLETQLNNRSGILFYFDSCQGQCCSDTIIKYLFFQKLKLLRNGELTHVTIILIRLKLKQ